MATTSSPSLNPQSILQFWTELEHFLPFDLDEVSVRNVEPPMRILRGEAFLPWNQQDLDIQILDNKNYRIENTYTIYIGAFKKQEVSDSLTKLYKNPRNDRDLRELDGETCFAQIQVTHTGDPVFKRIKVSTLPWALGRLKLGGFRKLHSDTASGRFEADFEALTEQIKVFEEKHRKPDWSFSVKEIEQLATIISQWSGFVPNHETGLCLIAREERRVPIKKSEELEERPNIETPHTETPKEKDASTAEQQDPEKEELESKELKRPKVEILNSFFIEDLTAVRSKIKDFAGPLKNYLEFPKVETKKLDLLNEENILKALELASPKYTPLGAWPAEMDHSMSLMQQVAINQTFEGKNPLIAVNGPPGTGKTTMLRDIIAGIITNRAEILSKLKKPKDAFLNKNPKVILQGKNLNRIRELIPELTGHEIIVASSNNNAVENVSKELPRNDSVGASWLEDLSYLKNTAKHIFCPEYQEPEDVKNVWGSITAVLGKYKNRSRFVESFFYANAAKKNKDQKKKELTADGPLDIFSYLRFHQDNKDESFQEAKKEFIKIKKEVLLLRDKLSIFHKKWFDLLKENKDLTATNKKLSLEAKSLGVTLPESLSVLDKTLQLASAFHTKEFTKLRSNLFIKALNLHEGWIKSQDGPRRDLVAVANFIKYPTKFEPEEAKLLWQLFFMIVPVVSTTFASMHRMFENVPFESLGYLLVDEAGQTAPQAVVGGLSRVKHAVVIGDPLQLEPVINIPETAIIAVARECFGGDIDELKTSLHTWSPRIQSAQTLVDRTSTIGGFIPQEHTGLPLWVGCPLRVHRRCLEPMFSISNNLAYGNMMIHAVGQRNCNLPKTIWYDTPGYTANEQWVPVQAEKLLRLIPLVFEEQMATGNEKDIYVITPFRAVAKELRPLVKNLLINQYEYQKGSAHKFAYERVGTVHTFQGKESSVVFLVLGADINMPGSIHWVGSKVNLINVALTRARDRLYVIGDKSAWLGASKGFVRCLDEL